MWMEYLYGITSVRIDHISPNTSLLSRIYQCCSVIFCNRASPDETCHLGVAVHYNTLALHECSNAHSQISPVNHTSGLKAHHDFEPTDGSE